MTIRTYPDLAKLPMRRYVEGETVYRLRRPTDPRDLKNAGPWRHFSGFTRDGAIRQGSPAKARSLYLEDLQALAPMIEAEGFRAVGPACFFGCETALSWGRPGACEKCIRETAEILESLKSDKHTNR